MILFALSTKYQDKQWKGLRMAAGGKDMEQIWISPRAKSILDSRKGSARKQIDELLGISKPAEATAPKVFTRPQNNLLDCLICTALRIAEGPLTKPQIYISVLDLASQHPTSNIKWTNVYKDFFKYESVLKRDEPLRVSIDNRLNKESKLLKSGMVQRTVTSKSPTWNLNEKDYKNIENWAYQVSNLIPSNTLVIPSLESVGTIQSAPVDWGLNEVFRESTQAYWNGILSYYNEALEKKENPWVYGSRKLKEEREAASSDKGQYKLWFGGDSNE